MNYTIKDTSILEECSVIGQGCFIGHHCVIRSNVTIGSNTVLAHHVIVEPDVVIGNNTTIQVFSAITTNTVIGNDTFIGPYFSTTNCKHIPDGPKGTNPRKKQPTLEKIVIGNNVIIGANCALTPGIRVGDGSIIGMNCFIMKDVPQNTKLKAGTVWK